MQELEKTTFKLKELQEKVQAYQINTDFLGVGLTALALVLAVLEIIFMLNATITAKSAARDTARTETAGYLNRLDI